MMHQRPSTAMELSLQTHQQRRPPDVEEALSSMLWTPYERTPTDSSSDDDDDERLNKKLRRSQSSFDYRSLPATPSSSTYFEADEALLMQAAASSSCFLSSATAYSSKAKRNAAAPLQINNISPITPFVPFTDLLYNNNNNNNCRSELSTPSNAAATATAIATVAIVQTIAGATTIPPPPTPPPPRLFNYQFHQQPNNHQQQQQELHQKGGDTNNGSNYDGCGRSDADNYRFSYPHFGQIPGLHKWWSTSGRVSSNATTASKEPPSYDSLYAESQQTATIACANLETTTRVSTAAAAKKDANETDNKENNQIVVDKSRVDNLSKNSSSANSSPVFSNQFRQQSTVPSSANLIASNNNGTLKGCEIFGRNKKLKENDRQNNNNSAGKPNRNQLPNVGIMRERQNTHSNDQLPRGQTWHWSNPYYGCEETNAYAAHASPKATFNLENDARTTTATTFTTDALIPNKCLAELERLYAEFRASESLIERQLNASYESESEEISKTRCDTLSGDKMRLNIPASENSTNAANSKTANASTSSVFLTTTNSVTSNSGGVGVGVGVSPKVSNHNNINNNHSNNQNNNQKLGLTIQVNEKSQSSLLSSQPKQQQQELVVHNNGVSVINCSYNNNSNNNNNNNNNNYTNQKSNSNNNCDQDNNNFVASSVINGSSVNSVTSASCSSSVPNSCNVNKNQSDAISGSVGGGVSGKKHNVDIVENHVNNNRRVNRATTTNNSVHIINVNNIPINAPNQGTAAAKAANITSPAARASSISTTTTSATTYPTPTSAPRTFTSTECQTDDILPASSPNREQRSSERPRASPRHAQAANVAPTSTREQRRRERRERRQQQQQLMAQQQQQHQQTNSPNLMPSMHAARRHIGERHSMPQAITHLHPPHMHPHATPPNATMPAAMSAMLRPMLPDLLHSHYPPPYSALPLPAACSNGPLGVSMLPPPTPSLLGHAPSGAAAAAVAAMQQSPPGTTILTPVISTVPIPGATPIVGGDGRFTLPLPIIRRSPSERSGKGCCGQWFAGPPLRALIAVVALGGVACALGGAALGATGLAGPPSSHLTAALLMIGVGVVLVTVSGAAWRMTAPGHTPCLGLGSSVDLGRCGRRPCSRGGGASHGLLYPEFQHRPPPPSYQASMQEYRLRLLLLDRDRQSGVVRGNSPPPTYRSHAGSLLRAPLTTTSRITGLTGGSGGVGGGCGGGGSSIGGSEYSFPPSYRSRNNTATPATICSERSIETTPSGRLLANEDIPEPLSVEQLPEYNAAQYGNNRRTAVTASVTPKTATSPASELRTSAIVEVAAVSVDDCRADDEKLSPRVSTSKEINNGSSILSSSTNGKELVTIVTISQPITAAVGGSGGSNGNDSSNNNHSSSSSHHKGTACSPTDHIEILAHL